MFLKIYKQNRLLEGSGSKDRWFSEGIPVLFGFVLKCGVEVGFRSEKGRFGNQKPFQTEPKRDEQLFTFVIFA